jgi:hypothetical protein
VGLRYDNWKIVFQEQRAHGFDVWQEPFVPLRVPKLFNLRSDPFEEGDHIGMDYTHWRVDRTFLLVSRAGIRREIHCHVQGIPPEPESRQLLARPGDGEARERANEWPVTPRAEHNSQSQRRTCSKPGAARFKN